MMTAVASMICRARTLFSSSRAEDDEEFRVEDFPFHEVEHYKSFKDYFPNSPRRFLWLFSSCLSDTFTPEEQRGFEALFENDPFEEFGYSFDPARAADDAKMREAREDEAMHRMRYYYPELFEMYLRVRGKTTEKHAEKAAVDEEYRKAVVDAAATYDELQRANDSLGPIRRKRLDARALEESLEQQIRDVRTQIRKARRQLRHNDALRNPKPSQVPQKSTYAYPPIKENY